MTITNAQIPADLAPFVQAAECDPFAVVAPAPRPPMPVRDHVAAEPLGVGDVLEIAADRVETIGWHVGPGWYAHGEDWDYPFVGRSVPAQSRPAWASTHIHIAGGAVPRGVMYGPVTVPPVVTCALEAWAQFLARRGEPELDGDRYLDVDKQIEAFEAADGMTAAEVAEALRDCAAELAR